MLIAVGTGSGNGSGSVGPHSHAAADVTDFNEAVDDRVAALLQAGSNVSLDYDDASGTLTLASTGGGLFTSVSDKAAGYTAADTDDKTLLNFTSAATLTLPPAASLPDGWTIGVRNGSGSAVRLVPQSGAAINGTTHLVLGTMRGVLLTKAGNNYMTLDHDMVLPQGTVYGFAAGGWSAGTVTDVIDRFLMTASTTSAEIGTLSLARYGGSGHSDTTNGYGYVSGGYTLAPQGVVDRFQLSASASAADVGVLSVARYVAAGTTDANGGYGYTSGGDTGPDTLLNARSNVIDRFAFAASSNAADVGDLTAARYYVYGISSSDHGYVLGGHVGSVSNIVDRHAFAAMSNAADVGDLSVARMGVSCTTDLDSSYGYAAGGMTSGVHTFIDRLQLVASANATSVGDLSQARHATSGHSDTTLGYGLAAGGYDSSAVVSIERYQFSSSANAVQVGDLSVPRSAVAGMEY